MSIARLMQMAAAGQAGDYQISRSLRFNSADSAYLSRTPASAGNLTTWTWSSWIKRTTLGTQIIFSSRSSPAIFQCAFLSGSTISIFDRTGGNVIQCQKISTQVFRDVGAWYHIMVVIDTGNATAAHRNRIYVNGVEIVDFGTSTNFGQNNNTSRWNSNVEQLIGSEPGENYFNGYLADINFIDGQALTPSSFGQIDSATGVWEPKAYTGTYGTNGFYLNFSDNTSTTTLGYDAAGSNDWTLNNFSVTAGAGNDSLVDSPTRYGTDTGAGGEMRGNYCTWNPLSNGAGTISDGNLRFAGTNSGFTRGNSTIAVSSGKWYFEVTLTTASSDTNIGIGQGFFTSKFPGEDALSYVQVLEAGQKQTSGNKINYGTSLTSGDVFMCAFDLDNNKIFFGKNGTWFDSSDPAAGTSPAYSLTSGTYCPIARPYSSSAVTDANFGQRPFAHTAPSGFKALCTTNLPDPTVVQGDDYFNTVLYDGTGSSQSITTVGFTPDFTWIKETNAAADHALYDAVRGVTKQLESNNTDAETTEATGLTAFVTGGFTVGALAQVNTSGDNYVAWNWKANGAGSSNTDGTITSTVSANTTAGISIVTYTGTGTDGATVGHGLGVAPVMIITKARNQSRAWYVWHQNLSGANYGLTLNTTSAEATFSAGTWGTKNSTIITAVEGTSLLNVNASGDTYVAYCFADVEGFSKFGSYTGNGSADGPFVFTGFRPAWVMIKISSTTGDWLLYDNKRNSYNVVNNILYPNANYAEAASGSAVLDFVSNGFKLRGSGSGFNDSGATFIYACFSQNPFKTSLAR